MENEICNWKQIYTHTYTHTCIIGAPGVGVREKLMEADHTEGEGELQGVTGKGAWGKRVKIERTEGNSQWRLQKIKFSKKK